MSNGKSIAKQSSVNESKMASSTKPQSSETLTTSSSPVALKNTRDLSMWLQQAFPANHLALQERKKDKTTKGTSGRKRSNVFATFDPDTRSWRTSQVCLILDTSAKSSLRWPKQGSMQDGLCSEQTMWERHTDARGSGYWPTPTASTNGPGKDPNNPRGMHQGNALATAVQMWPTPTARDWKDNGKSPAELARNSVTLATHAGGQLNPTWVEWLMGWPLGWTDLKPLETDKFQQWLQQHGKS